MEILEQNILNDYIYESNTGYFFYNVVLVDNSRYSVWIDKEKFKNIPDEILLRYFRQAFITQKSVTINLKNKKGYNYDIRFRMAFSNNKVNPKYGTPRVDLIIEKNLSILNNEYNMNLKINEAMLSLIVNHIEGMLYCTIVDHTVKKQLISKFNYGLYNTCKSWLEKYKVDVNKYTITTIVAYDYIDAIAYNYTSRKQKNNTYVAIKLYKDDILVGTKVIVYDKNRKLMDKKCDYREFETIFMNATELVSEKTLSMQDELYQDIQDNGLLATIQNDLENAATKMSLTDATKLNNIISRHDFENYTINDEDIKYIIYKFYNLENDINLDINKIREYKIKIQDLLILYYYCIYLPPVAKGSSDYYIQIISKFTVTHNLVDLAGRITKGIDTKRIAGPKAAHIRKMLHNKFRNTKSNINKEYITIVVKGTIRNMDITSIEQQREICSKLNKLDEYINVDTDTEKSAILLTSVELADDYNEFIFYTKTYLEDEYSDRVISADESLIKSGRFQQITKMYNSIYNEELHFSFSIITASEDTKG